MEEKARDYRSLQAQAVELKRQLEVIQSLLAECLSAERSLDSLDGDAFFQLGSGVTALAKPSGGFFVEVGSGVVVEAKREDAKVMLAKKRQKLERAFDATEAAFVEAARQLSQLEEELSKG